MTIQVRCSFWVLCIRNGTATETTCKSECLDIRKALLGCQNSGPCLGAVDVWDRVIMEPEKRGHNLDNPHIMVHPEPGFLFALALAEEADIPEP